MTRSIAAVALVVSAALLACGADPNVKSAAARGTGFQVVSLSPLASEVLLAIGGEATLIAVDPGSQRLPELGHLPAVDLGQVAGLEPDLALLPPVENDETTIAALKESGVFVLEFAPHDFDDAFELCRLLGEALGKGDVMRAYIHELSEDLAHLSASTRGYVRPRVAAVLRLSPLEIAGGHSFTTDLIEIVGAESVTHGTEEPRIPTTVEELHRLTPDLVVLVSDTPWARHEQERARSALHDFPHIAFLTFDPDSIWLHGGAETARALRAFVEPFAQEFVPRPQNTPNPAVP